MRLHVIIDFMHIYYKYYFRVRDGKLARLSAPINWNGTVIAKDTTLIYYPLKDIEYIRKNFEMLGHDVTMSVCFDTPSNRKDIEGGEEYKSGRQHTLKQEDFENISFIENMLREAGHNTYRCEGYEADDLANHLVRKFKDNFDYTVIYTNDKDLLVNIGDKVGVMRFKQGKGYCQVDRNNYEDYLEKEFKVFIPYNALGLFLSSVGDSADKIKGINRFGPKAFGKLITKMAYKYKIDWSVCGDYDELNKVVALCEEFLTPEQFKELQIGFSLVANLELLDELPEPSLKSTHELRYNSYSKYNMISLYS